MTNPNHQEALQPPQTYEDVLYSMYTLIDLNKLRDFNSLRGVQDVVRDPHFYDQDGVVQTPLRSRFSAWEYLDQFTKLETDQNIGAFKARGAAAGGEAIMVNYPTTRYMCAYSAGNHGLGVAQFVKTWNQRVVRRGLGTGRLLEAHIFVAEKASIDKISLLKEFEEYGAVLHVGGSSLGEAGEQCEKFLSDMNGSTPSEQPVAQLLHPYKNPDVIAGQSTALLEGIFQLRDEGVDLTAKPLHWYVGYGGGGLAIGSAVLMEYLIQLGVVHPNSKVIAAQMDRCDSTIRAMERLDQNYYDLDDLFIDPASGADVFDPSADGTAVRNPDLGNVEVTRYLKQRGVLEMRSVSKKSVADAMRLQDVAREPAGALGEAAARDDQNQRAPHWIGDDQLQLQEAAVVVTVASGCNRSDDTVAHFEQSAASHERAGVAIALGGATVRKMPEQPRARTGRVARHASAAGLRGSEKRGPF